MAVKSTLPKKSEELDGVTKAAIVLLSLDHQAAARILREMSAEQVEEVTRVLASLGEVPIELTFSVIEEFYRIQLGRGFSREGGLDQAVSLLKDSLDHSIAERLIAQIQTQVQKTPFAFLQKAESENLLAFIKDEHPQTIALIISHMPHHKASEILARLPDSQQIAVVRRVANMEQTNPDIIRDVEGGLEARLASMLMSATSKVGGVETVAEVLNLIDRTTEKSIMEGIEEDDPELVEEIRRLMFVFEDVNLVNDKGIQAVLKEVDNDELCLALKTASQELQDKIFSNMSQRAGDLIKEDMEYMGPVRLADVEGAQQRIVDVVRRLEESGEIIIAGRGGEKDMIV